MTPPASEASAPARREIPTEVAVRPHIGRWIAVVVILAIVVLVVQSVATNPRLDLSVVATYVVNGQILLGLLRTLLLAVFSIVGAVIVGTVVGFLSLSSNPVARAVTNFYLWMSRGVPTLIQVLLWGNLALFVPNIALGIPWTSISWFSVSTNAVVQPFTAAVIALTFANGGYIGEIVRSGILAIPEGQREASAALGLSWWQTQRRVILPQALRVMIPPASNQFITILKETSLVAVIAGGDILSQAQTISSLNLRTIELLAVASIWYLVVVSAAMVGQSMIERRLGRRTSRTRATTATVAIATQKKGRTR